jgi:hypothetical protein
VNGWLAVFALTPSKKHDSLDLTSRFLRLA